jgi:hypothetical protein
MPSISRKKAAVKVKAAASRVAGTPRASTPGPLRLSVEERRVLKTPKGAAAAGSRGSGGAPPDAPRKAATRPSEEERLATMHAICDEMHRLERRLTVLHEQLSLFLGVHGKMKPEKERDYSKPWQQRPSLSQADGGDNIRCQKSPEITYSYQARKGQESRPIVRFTTINSGFIDETHAGPGLTLMRVIRALRRMAADADGSNPESSSYYRYDTAIFEGPYVVALLRHLNDGHGGCTILWPEMRPDWLKQCSLCGKLLDTPFNPEPDKPSAA